MTSATECDRARQELLDPRNAGELNASLGLALDGCIDLDDDSSVARAVKHVQACPACQSWRETELQPELFDRRRRIQNYCCGEMFRAVEGPGRSIFLQPSGPEILHSWTFGAWGPTIRFCPWCGTGLP